MSESHNLVLPQPDTEAAIRFLQMFEPEGPWVLTAIPPHRKGIQTRTFGPGSINELREWLAERNGFANLYFHVNRPLKHLDKKAERQDIKEVRWLHVDVDPRAGEPLEEEQQRILSLLTNNLPASVPKPTLIVYSGGGYQAFWKLREPIPIDGNLSHADSAARYNLSLEQHFHADHCHNIDRIMRLPGTLNIPDERKRKKGREIALAGVVEFDESLSYPLASFQQAPLPRGDHSAQLGRPGEVVDTVKISGNVPRITDLSELDQWNVPERVKVIIGQGHHPDETKSNDNSRSAWLFDAVCSLLRYSVPDEVIFSLITDSAWAVLESVLDNKRNADRYAVRQIERGKEEVENPNLRRLNETHFVVMNDAGRCRVAEWTSSHNGREQLSLQTFEDFKNRYCNVQVEVGTNGQGARLVKPLGEYWLKHPKRRQFLGFVFSPGEDKVIKGCLNLWRGFGVEPELGDWSKMEEHISEVLAAGDQGCADYILRWAAWALQNPAEPAEVALVFKGGQGTGKSTFGRAMTRLFGQHGLQVSSPGQFAGRFNSHLRDVCLLFADEAVRPDDKPSRSTLKSLLTEKELSLEGKGRDIIPASNHVKVIMASNDAWIVPAEVDDRRFAVFAVSEKHKQNRAYFSALNAELDSGGLEAMLHGLLAFDLGEWHPRNDIPRTAERDEQKIATLAGFESLFLDMLREGQTVVHRTGDRGEVVVSTSEMAEYAQRRLRREEVSWNRVSNMFSKLGFQRTTGRPRGFWLPPLPQARDAFDCAFTKIEWNDLTEWDPSRIRPELSIPRSNSRTDLSTRPAPRLPLG